MNGTLLRLSLRLSRTGFVACAVIGALSGVLQAGGFATAAGGTPAERQIFSAQMDPLAAQMIYLLSLPLRLDTLAGLLKCR